MKLSTVLAVIAFTVAMVVTVGDWFSVLQPDADVTQSLALATFLIAAAAYFRIGGS